MKTLRELRAHFVTEHWKVENPNNIDECSICDRRVIRYTSHISRHHIDHILYCKLCSESFTTEKDVTSHMTQRHSTPVNSIFNVVESAFNRRIQLFETKFANNQFLTLDAAFVHIGGPITRLIKHQLQQKFLLKVAIVLKTKYVKYDEMGAIDEVVNVFLRSLSKPALLANINNTDKLVNECMLDITTRNEQFIGSGSGWTLNQVTSANIEIGKLSLSGGCSNAINNIQQNKHKFLIDAKTQGNECFYNSVSIGLLPSSTHDLGAEKLGILARAYTKTNLVTTPFSLPFDVRNIKKFEKKNALKRRINVYTIIQGEITPIHVSVRSKNFPVINLLLIRKNKGVDHHYIYIKNFDRFCDGPSERKYHCTRCMNCFSSTDALENHLDLCESEDFVKIEYPEEGTDVAFRSHEKQVMQGIIGACDFEASLRPISRKENAEKYNCANCNNEGNIKLCTHNTTDCHHQIPTSYSFMLCDKSGQIIYSKTESDEQNVMEIFFKTLDYVEHNFFPLLQRHREKTDYKPNEELNFHKATHCYLCKEVFQQNVNSKYKVRDHCHYSNEYLGAAHNSCNWRRTCERAIPIFIHNFKNYDSQFILQGLQYSNKKIEGIPYNMEKFRTLQIGKLCFVDSMQMLPLSLSNLVDDLRNSNHTFPLILQIPIFKKYPFHKDDLLKKGVYPYEWASSITKLINTEKFPKRKHFFSSLYQSNISEDEYQHGKKVFKNYKCKNMLDYCHLYCTLDTVLLLEVIMSFREMVFSEWNLDCTKYISAPQLAYDCMLLSLDEPIDLMTDSEMIMLCEQNIRGGVSFVNERHVRIKNYLQGNDVENKVQDQLLYIDANNLYSVAQSLPMPHSGYTWCNEKEKNQLYSCLPSIPIDNDIGFILEVDLKYPQSLHEKHSSLPLLPEHVTFSFDDLSFYTQQSLIALRGESIAHKYSATKLVTNVKDKFKYVTHYRNLQTYLQAGIELIKIHRVIKFRQKRYIKPYIDKCTKKRQETKSHFKKMIFKLFTNSVYGKFIQNNRTHFEVKICTKYSNFHKHYNSLTYKGHRILSENVVAVYKNKAKVKLDKLYATGFSILELSKNHMYNSWYNFIQPALGENNVSIVLSDTDSFIIHVQNMTRNDVLDQLSECMDFSNYPKSHPRFSLKHKSIPGYFKDENSSNYMVEVIGLKSKCYITKVKQRGGKTKEQVVCKGITKPARSKLSMATFRNVIKDYKNIKVDILCIRSKKHELYTQRISKIALSTTDDKRYLKSCGVHSLPHGSCETYLCNKC